MDSIIGRTILGYKVKEKIGTGSFGEVYRVEKKNLVVDSTRALKVITLPKDNQYNEVLNTMGGNKKSVDAYFKKELDHVVNEIGVFSMISEEDNHNIVSYHESDVEKLDNGRYNIYILMEMLTPLDKWLRFNNITVDEGIKISLDIANALKICHKNKIIHRDIKLSNIFVSKSGKFKLGDFGVSKSFNTLTGANTVKGTPYYIAPEIYASKYDNTEDIYSLGIVMYYLFNKRRFPFLPNYPDSYNQDDENNAFYKRMKYEIPDLPENAPGKLGNIIQKTMAKPEDRYEKISELITELKSIRDTLSEDEKEIKLGFGEETNTNLNEKTKIIDNTNPSRDTFHIELKDTNNQNDKRKRLFIVVLSVLIIAITGGVLALSSWNDKKTIKGISKETYITIYETFNESTKVETTVSYIEIKNYENKRSKEVIEFLKSKGLLVSLNKKYSTKVKKGNVISQSMKRGTKVLPGSEITLTVSKGKKKVLTKETTAYIEPQSKTNNYTNSSSSSSKSTEKKKEEFSFDDIVK